MSPEGLQPLGVRTWLYVPHWSLHCDDVQAHAEEDKLLEDEGVGALQRAAEITPRRRIREEPFQVGLGQAYPERTERRVGAVWLTHTVTRTVIPAHIFCDRRK